MENCALWFKKIYIQKANAKVQKVRKTSKTTFYNDQPHYNIIKNLKNSEILAISEKIQRDEKLSEYFKMFDKSLKLPY